MRPDFSSQHPSHQRHRRQHPADAGDDVIDRSDPGVVENRRELRDRHGDQRPHDHQRKQRECPDQLANAHGHGGIWLGFGSRLMRRGGQDYMVGTASRKPQILKLMLKPQSPTARRPTIRAWLYAVAALMVLTLVVGGATRLTESGLSIVEWKPVTGVIPPLSQEAWQAEFGQYQQNPQHRGLNRVI